MRYCGKCGSQMEDHMAFCTSCGTPLKKTETATDTPVQPTAQTPPIAQTQTPPTGQPSYPQAPVAAQGMPQPPIQPPPMPMQGANTVPPPGNQPPAQPMPGSPQQAPVGGQPMPPYQQPMAPQQGQPFYQPPPQPYGQGGYPVQGGWSGMVPQDRSKPHGFAKGWFIFAAIVNGFMFLVMAYLLGTDEYSINTTATVISLLTTGAAVAGYILLLMGKRIGFFFVCGAAGVSMLTNLAYGAVLQAVGNIVAPVITWFMVRGYWNDWGPQPSGPQGGNQQRPY